MVERRRSHCKGACQSSLVDPQTSSPTEGECGIDVVNKLKSPHSQQGAFLWMTATCAVIFSVYWRTLAPSIAGGDR